ncbi:MAG: polymorphic toxin type 35 domain-containing protein [Candidatus Babeliales bacterium]
MKEHIFSKNHKNSGIYNLGNSEDDILEKFVNIVKLADTKGLLEAGPNQIHTIINNQKVVIRTFIKEGIVLRVNGFIEINVNNIGNVFQLLVKEYQHE